MSSPAGVAEPVAPGPPALGDLSAEIVAAYNARNAVMPGDLPALISTVHGTLAGLGRQAPEVVDDRLRAVLGQDRCTMFEMQKLFSPHLTAA